MNCYLFSLSKEFVLVWIVFINKVFEGLSLILGLKFLKRGLVGLRFEK